MTYHRPGTQDGAGKTLCTQQWDTTAEQSSCWKQETDHQTGEGWFPGFFFSVSALFLYFLFLSVSQLGGQNTHKDVTLRHWTFPSKEQTP